MTLIPRSFFERATTEVARELIGVRIHFKTHSGIITETEAYVGKDDPACHAAKGLTPRTKVMFGPAGHSYVYLIYGMYHCLNIVTEKEGFPAAVLIRGVLWEQKKHHLNGPGKLCRAWQITKEHNDFDMCSTGDFTLTERSAPLNILTTPRIGIKVGTEYLWRFVMPAEDVLERSQHELT